MAGSCPAVTGAFACRAAVCAPVVAPPVVETPVVGPLVVVTPAVLTIGTCDRRSHDAPDSPC